MLSMLEQSVTDVDELEGGVGMGTFLCLALSSVGNRILTFSAVFSAAMEVARGSFVE